MVYVCFMMAHNQQLDKSMMLNAKAHLPSKLAIMIPLGRLTILSPMFFKFAFYLPDMSQSHVKLHDP